MAGMDELNLPKNRTGKKYVYIHFRVATGRGPVMFGRMTRHFILLVSIFSTFQLQAQIFGPGGLVKTPQLGSPLVTPPTALPGAPSMVFINPPQALPMYGPRMHPGYQSMPMMQPGFGVMPQPASYTLPATVLGGIAGGLIGDKKGKAIEGVAIGAAAGLVMGQVLDRQAEQRAARQRAMMMPMAQPFAANPYNPYFSMGHTPGSYMIITPPRMPATWVSSSMFGRNPSPYVR